MPRKLLLPMAVVVITIALVSMLYISKPVAQKREQAPEPLVKVAVQELRYARHTLLLPSQGLVKAQTDTTLSAQVSGVVQQIESAAREQGSFEQGDLLLTLDDRDYQAAYELAVAQLQESQVSLQQEQARAEQAKRDWQRINKDQKANDLVLRKPQLLAAQAKLKASQAQLEQAKLNLERTRIRAPFTGASTQLHVGQGQYVTPGSPLAAVVSTKALEVMLPISAQWRSLLPEINSANENPVVQLYTENGQSLSAELVRQAAVIDTANRQMHWVARIAKADAGTRLMAGDFVRADIPSRPLDNVAVLPIQALVNGTRVWQVVDQRLQKQAVDVLWQDGENVYISGGLEEGAQISITPLARVVSGTKVELLSAAESSPQ